MAKYIGKPSKYNLTPYVEVKNKNYKVTKGWMAIAAELNKTIIDLHKNKKKIVVVVETYQGIIHEEVMTNLKEKLHYDRFVHAEEFMLTEEEIKKLVYPDVTDDRVFGYLTRLEIDAFYDKTAVKEIRSELEQTEKGIIVIYGTGAAYLCPNADLLIYADMARWEIQLRMRRHKVDNLGVKNRNTPDAGLLYKQGFFVDWRVCDRLKKKLFDRWDYVLDTNKQGEPKLIEGEAVLEGLKIAAHQPFSVVPYFDAAPWGGQWMKEVCHLDPAAQNYGWCFNCIPEENSLLLKFGEDIIEIPSINTVFRHPVELLGDPVHARFGDEFPIRFDFLDTMQGGNLSLQVHPLTEYIQQKFGMHYTQDESYYLMDAAEEAYVYLGLKEGVDSVQMLEELEEAQREGTPFDAEKHVQRWPVKKHDHVLIPAGTVHCSGKNSMVLEISATPYIFTFKLWDWGRLGLDGKPRPINIGHGRNVIQWHRTTKWTKNNLVNRIEKIAEGDGWEEERTGLHKREFIETRRLWFSKKTEHCTGESVNVICLVEGEEIVVESPNHVFDPIIFHYAEVFIVPASVDIYTICPYGESENKVCGIIKAYVR
jgi:mannose-6-phosphate isomerase class I